MSAPEGNQFWKARSKHGRDRIFNSPDKLWEAACEYFEWVENNPLWEAKYTQYQGEPVDITVPKMRAMTIEGLCRFLGVNSKYLHQFESGLDLDKSIDKDFSHIICDIKEIIYDQKFSGAAADLLNANIISRDLGLSDKSQHDHNHKIIDDGSNEW